ncbi:MAG TPA: cytochrome P450 [Trebonia sp.]|jgi:cytochrome P450|nr:cytochrome P450 [Trebonia sp.]
MRIPPSHVNAARLYGPEFAIDPAEVYARIRREHGRVAPVLLDGDVPAWLVLAYREIHHVTSNPQIFARRSQGWNLWDEIPADWPLRPIVAYMPSHIHAEGAERQRRAAAIGDALEATDPTEVARVSEKTADQLIDEFAGDGKADLIAQYAVKLPMMVLSRLYGFPESQIPGLTADLLTMSTATDSSAVEANQRVMAMLAELVKSHREKPGVGMTGRLVRHPAGLTDAELVVDMFVLLIFGQAPSTDWIGNTLRLMLIDDHFSLTLQGGRSSVDQALNEVLWKDTPIQQAIARYPTQDYELAGQRIAKGDMLILGLASANADPQVRPESFGNIGANRAHMSFSHGDHACPVGAPEIAEGMTRTAVEVLLDRIPDVELAIPADLLRWKETSIMRGLESLPVTFTPTAAR